MPDSGAIGPGADGGGATPSARTELARTLREWRARAGDVPQKTVARRLNIAQTTVSRYESPDGRHPAPEAAVRALWSCYRLAEEDLALALALRARVDGELRAGAGGDGAGADGTAADGAGADGAAVDGKEADGDASVVDVVPAAGPLPAPARERGRHRVAWAAGIVAALAGVAAGGLLVHQLLGPTAADRSDDARPVPAQAPPAVTATAADATATAAASCRAVGCLHVEPNTTVCQRDAVTTAQGRDFGVLVELRFSPGCQAAWARMSGSSPGDRVQVFGREGTPPDQEEYRQQTGRTAHTQMVRSAGPADARACAIVDARGTVCATEVPTPPAAPAPTPTSAPAPDPS
ncbi:DUF2690 domain-containing protein [Kitasatospora misakiensis]|uniref:DUF2690 domain-containing protein n=1 Tax=Kitasatospora misakiensis TaxID=67330 RepID=A0ABW0X7J9_9ACTN